MLKRLRAKHPVGFCVLSEVLFLGSLLLASYLIVFALVLFGVDLERVDSYFLSAVQEAVGMVVALVILGRTGKMYLLRRRGSGFFNGLLVGMYPLVLIGYSLYTKLMFGMPEDGQLQPAFSIFSFFLSMALVGVAEEFIFRGVIAQSLLERFGTGRAGVWKACLLSGLLFGAAHLTNLLSSAPFGVLMQHRWARCSQPSISAPATCGSRCSCTGPWTLPLCWWAACTARRTWPRAFRAMMPA